MPQPSTTPKGPHDSGQNAAEIDRALADYRSQQSHPPLCSDTQCCLCRPQVLRQGGSR